MKLSITSVLTRLNENRFVRRAFYFILLIALIVLFFDTKDNGHDFEVMRRAAHSYLHGEPIYSIARDGGMVFKYPPWLIFIFLPFGLLPVPFAGTAWALVSAIALGSIYFQLRLLGFSFLSVAFSFLAFWGIWAVHFIDGQSEVLILALFLYLFRKMKQAPAGFTALSAFLLTIKGPSAIGSLGLLNKKNFFKSGMILAVIVFTLTCFVALTSTHHWGVLSDWKEAATSGSSHLEPGRALVGRDNQGIPALIHRVSMDVSASPLPEFWVNTLVIILGGSIFLFLFLALGPTEAAIFWLAGSVVIHPLCWFHLYVWTFPFAVWVADQAIQRKRHLVWLLFPLLVAAVTERTLGSVGKSLEFYSFKAVVVLVALIWFSITQKNKMRV